MSRKRFVALVLLPLLAAPLAAADGDLDPSFWMDGTVYLSAALDFEFGGFAADSSGQLAVAMSFTPAGTELAYWRSVGDLALGTLCRVDPVPSTPLDTRILDIAFDLYGRLLVLARTTQEDTSLQQFYVLAFAFPGCALDTSYGTNGVATLPGFDLPGFYDNRRLVPLANGRSLVAGHDTDFNEPDAPSRVRVLRLESNGSVGATFRAPADTFVFSATGVDVAAATNSHYVALAEQLGFGASRDFLFIDFAADGTLLGTLTVPFDLGGDDDDAPSAIAATSDGRVVAVGSIDREVPLISSAAMVMLHWNIDGALELDPAFDGDGKKYFFFDSRAASGLRDVVVQGDGRILVAGFADSVLVNSAMGVGRLNPDGSFDSAFNPDGTGRRIVDFEGGGSNNDYANRVALPNGRVALAGPVSFTGDVTSIGVARLLNAYVFASGFEPPEASGGWGFSPVPPP